MPSITLRAYDLGPLPGHPPAPEPEFQDTVADPEAARDDSGVWRHSSRDLEQGLDVVEVPIDTLPGDLVDGLLPPLRRKPA